MSWSYAGLWLVIGINGCLLIINGLGLARNTRRGRELNRALASVRQRNRLGLAPPAQLDLGKAGVNFPV